MKIAVVGAHLSGQPLNYQLTDRGGKLVRTTKTAPHYRMYALTNSKPHKPGLLNALEPMGEGIEVEIWELGAAEFADFVESIPAPMCIGTLQLEDGSTVKGFLVEYYATKGAEEITHLGGWRNYLNSRGS
jgi:allophanate hydrolase